MCSWVYRIDVFFSNNFKNFWRSRVCNVAAGTLYRHYVIGVVIPARMWILKASNCLHEFSLRISRLQARCDKTNITKRGKYCREMPFSIYQYLKDTVAPLLLRELSTSPCAREPIGPGMTQAASFPKPTLAKSTALDKYFDRYLRLTPTAELLPLPSRRESDRWSIQFLTRAKPPLS